MVTEPTMEDQDRTVLLQIAKRAVARAASGSTDPIDPPAAEGVLAAPGAAFVTLHGADGSLRGCVGTTAARRPLYAVVAEMAEAAALRDPRFVPVRSDEVAELGVEVSVLTPLERIADISQVEVGTHGILIETAGARGLLLPQVATEYGWDAQTLAEHACRKAGLPSDAYKDPAVELFRFRVESVEEAGATS